MYHCYRFVGLVALLAAACGTSPSAKDASENGGTSATGGRHSGRAGSAGAAGVAATAGGPTSEVASSLAQKYAEYFPIGAAIDPSSYVTHADLLKPQFNSITAENEMKFGWLETKEGVFTYDVADRIVDFAVNNNMKVRGHNFVWHSQNPAWLFVDSTGATASKEALLARLKNHITNVMGHYRGKVYAWDVVNEAIMEDGTYRTGVGVDGKTSQWYAIIGESYIAEAFKYAHEADPTAKLFYNDYYDYIPAKQQGIYSMLKGLLEQGVPIHGVGMQCHLNVEPSSDPANQAYYQNVDQLEAAIKLYASLGLEVQVTELDVSLYIPGVTYTTSTFYTAATFTEELQAKQAARYKDFFELFRKYRDVITGVTFWGIADDNTWLSEFSSGRKDFPLLFDTNHQPKLAFQAVMDF